MADARVLIVDDDPALLRVHDARVGDQVLDLTPQEFALLTMLARNAGKVLTHRTILDHVWGSGQALDTLRTHVSQLRRKLGEGDDVPPIVTEPGVGYRMLSRRRAGPRLNGADPSLTPR